MINIKNALIKSHRAVDYARAADRSWAQSVIASPFIFLPCDLAVNSGANPGALANYGNVGPANFTVVDTHAPIEYDDNEGVYTGSPTGLTNYVHSNNATYDAAGNSLFDLFDIFRNYSAATKNGGGILVASFRLKVMASQAGGPIIMFGSTNASGGQGYSIEHSAAANDDMTHYGWQNSAVPFVNNVEITDSAGALVPDDNTERHITVMLNAKDANIANDAIKLAVDGVVKTVNTASTITAAWRGLTCPNGVTLFGRNSTNTPGSRTVASVLKGRVRDLVVVNLTNWPGDAVGEFPALAAALAAAPKYALPRYLEKF